MWILIQTIINDDIPVMNKNSPLKTLLWMIYSLLMNASVINILMDLYIDKTRQK